MPAPLVARGVATPRFRWYTLAQAVSIVGTTMSLTALYWLAQWPECAGRWPVLAP